MHEGDCLRDDFLDGEFRTIEKPMAYDAEKARNGEVEQKFDVVSRQR